MGNSLMKLPLTSPWELWEDEEKLNYEATYSLNRLLHRSQERGIPMTTDNQAAESIHRAHSRLQDFALKPFDCRTHQQRPTRSSTALARPSMVLIPHGLTMDYD